MRAEPSVLQCVEHCGVRFVQSLRGHFCEQSSSLSVERDAVEQQP